MMQRVRPLLWLLSGVVLAVVLGFGSAAPQPQRVSELVARIDALEELTREQARDLAGLEVRLAKLEAAQDDAPVKVPATPEPESDYPLPEGWETRVSSDGILSYGYDPQWEIDGDEPGALDFWIDDEAGLFFSWDWPEDLMDDLTTDEEFLRFFEEDLLAGEDEDEYTILDTGQTRFLSGAAQFWEVRLESADGYAAEMLTVFYACGARENCNLTLVRLEKDGGFDDRDWEFLATFAHQVDFLTVGKATVTANANLRACPAIDCEVVGRVLDGEIVEVVGISRDGEWYRLRSGEWISASLVEDAPPNLPVIDGDGEI